MSIIDDCVQFLEDLILGDFNEQQMVSAQVIGGLVSLIPVMDQVMDARDISGCLYRINKRGGFAKATLDDKVDLGFAAFGVVPAVGSAFKTVFKPLYKQRKAAKGIMNGGVAMIERMLGHRKGGAVRWVKTLDWAGNTQAAIVQADLALESCISMLEYLGQSHWWCPDRLEQLALDVAPPLRSMRGKLAAPIREAAEAIREFVEDLLGEHAAAVAMSVSYGMVASSRPRTTVGNSRGRSHSTHTNVGGNARTQGKTTNSGVTNSVQNTAYELYRPLDYGLKGLVGEHICEHYIIEHKNWGLDWNRHDMHGGGKGKAPGWQTDCRKINDKEIPIYLCAHKNRVFENGIDSAWLTNREKPHEFAIVEAKASMSTSPKLINMLSEAEAKPGSSVKAGGRRKSSSGKPVRAPTTKKPVEPSRILQMSRKWINDRIVKDMRRWSNSMTRNYSRHVILVTPLQAAEHIRTTEIIAEEKLVDKPLEAQKYASMHAEHAIQKEYGERELNEAEKEYKKSGKPPRPKGK